METGWTVSGLPLIGFSAMPKNALLNGSTLLPSLLVPSGKRIRLSPASSRAVMLSR